MLGAQFYPVFGIKNLKIIFINDFRDYKIKKEIFIQILIQLFFNALFATM